MSGPGDRDVDDTPHAGRAGAAEKSQAAAIKKSSREERLAKALRDNLRRRKAGAKKD